MSILVGRQRARAISDAPLKRSTAPTIREKQPAEAISHGRRARALAAGVQPLNMPREFTVAIAT